MEPSESDAEMRRASRFLHRMGIGRTRLLAMLAVIAILLTGRATEAAARHAIAEDFARQDQTLEYHLLLNDRTYPSERQLAKTLPARFLELLAPLIHVEPAAKPKAVIYLDSPERILLKNNLILRVHEGIITLKSRGFSPEAVVDLEKCSGKKYEVDFVGLPEYSVSSDVRFRKEELDGSLTSISPETVYAFLEAKCPAAFLTYKPFLNDKPPIRIPGAAIMLDSKAKLIHSLAAKVKDTGLSVWLFPPTNRQLIELAFRGYMRDRAELNKLYGEILDFLNGRDLLNPLKITKTEYYFDVYFGR
jgi:hypothetical protein